MRAAVGRLTAWEYRDSYKGIKLRDGPLNGLYGGFAFAACSALVDMGAKMPPAGRRTAHKRREAGRVYRDIGGALLASEGHKKPPPDWPGAGSVMQSRYSAGCPART